MQSDTGADVNKLRPPTTSRPITQKDTTKTTENHPDNLCRHANCQSQAEIEQSKFKRMSQIQAKIQKTRPYEVSSHEWRQDVLPLHLAWEREAQSFYEYHAQIKNSRISHDINKLWLPNMEIKLAGAIGLTLRTNDGVTDDEVNTGVRTVKRLYRAHNRKMDCLKILYPTNPAVPTSNERYHGRDYP